MSERKDLAQRIADVINNGRLSSPYGGQVSTQGRCYVVGFSVPVLLDGEVKVYSHKFIQVKFTTLIRDLPHKSSRVYGSEGDVIQFLREAFIKRNYEKALLIPTK